MKLGKFYTSESNNVLSVCFTDVNFNIRHNFKALEKGTFIFVIFILPVKCFNGHKRPFNLDYDMLK